MAGHAGSFWAPSARAAGAVPGAAPWLCRSLELGPSWAPRAGCRGEAEPWPCWWPEQSVRAAAEILAPRCVGAGSRCARLEPWQPHLPAGCAGTQLCLLLPGTGPGWWAARMDHDHLAGAGASKQSVPCHPAGWSSVLELRVTAQIPCLSQSSLRDNKPESRLTYICFIIKLMRLFSLLYAPLNSVFEILRRAGALQSGHALRSSATLVVFVLEHPNHAAAACSLGSLSLQRLVWLRDECSVCYCYLFSLFFSLHALITSLSASYFPSL